MRKYLSLLPTLLLAGCSGLFHSDARPDQVYYIRATAPQKGGEHIAASLRFNRPTAAPGLDSSQIVLVQPDRRMSYYSASRWPAPASNMIEMLSVEKLRGVGVWQSVGDSGSAFPSDYVMQVTIRRFEADYTGGGSSPEVHVVLDCLVGRREGREVLANFIAEGSAPADANRQSAVVAAFEKATNDAIDSMSTQAADTIRSAIH